MSEQMKNAFVGDVVLELNQIEKMSQKNSDDAGELSITYTGGGFLTLLCCYPS
jgi:hypothetical protein